jgi:hypothetical protein
MGGNGDHPRLAWQCEFVAVDPHEIRPALQRGINSVRNGTSAVISVRLPRLLQKD